MRGLATAFVSLFAALTTTACGEDVAGSPEPAEVTYDGPLYLEPAEAKHPKAGAAGDVVKCRNWGTGGFSRQDVYSEGATADSPDKALIAARSEWLYDGASEGLQRAKEEKDRVLYVLPVNGVWKQALIVRNGAATEGTGGDGWYLESWARCDYSELPRDYTESIGLQIWTDSTGRPASTKVVESWTGSEHCDWQSMTFLNLGKDRVHVRDPQPELDEYFAEPYREHVEVPADAVETGFSRDGRYLWLSSDEARAFVGTKLDAEAWPRTIQQLGCA